MAAQRQHQQRCKQQHPGRSEWGPAAAAAAVVLIVARRIIRIIMSILIMTITREKGEREGGTDSLPRVGVM